MPETTDDTSLKLEVEESDQAIIVRLRGSVTISDAEDLQQRLEELIAKQPSTVVLDLSEMDFICSSGLGAIIVGYLKSRHHKGKFYLANAQPAVRELLETTRLTKLFAIYSSVAEALAS